MFPSRNFFIGLVLSNVVVFFLVRISLVILSSFDILNSVDILNLFDISNLNIILALLITDLITIIVHLIFGNTNVPIGNINLVIVTIPPGHVPLSVLVFVFVFIIFVLSFSIPSLQEETISGQDDSQSSSPEPPVVQPDDSLYFGYIPDASPISSEKDEHFSGYCSELKDYLEEKKYKFEKAEIKYGDRFQRTARKIINTPDGKTQVRPIPKDNLIIECSANTITEDRRKQIYEEGGGHFSEPFAKTGAKLLIQKNLLESLKPQHLSLPLENQEIGILGKTTTSSLIKSVYTNSIPKAYPNRGDVIKALNKQKLTIYSSDSILLKYMLESEKSGLEEKDQYIIWPEHFLSHENYGVVVYGVYKDYKDNAYDSRYRQLQDTTNNFDGEYGDLLKSINEWITSEEGQEAYNKYINQFAQ